MTFHRFKLTRTPCPLVGQHPVLYPLPVVVTSSYLPFSPLKHHLIVPSALPVCALRSLTGTPLLHREPSISAIADARSAADRGREHAHGTCSYACESQSLWLHLRFNLLAVKV
jgi:hypothetical protein